MINAKMGAFLLTAFIAGAFVASPELRAYAANTVGSADIINNSILSADIKDGEVKTVDLGGNAVTSAKIKDGEVKGAEIATDAVGAAELAGVTKFLFGQCNPSGAVGAQFNAHIGTIVSCNINGVDTDDSIITTLDGVQNPCFVASHAFITSSDVVNVVIRNDCSFAATFQSGSSIAVSVYDK
ncbi:MAG TPA: hypothetical protein VGQ03_06510 [Nitrososphaera sp.]|jgi:hypothetical protein|nr:hypothetical protein [Nitrososphaera sp.]